MTKNNAEKTIQDLEIEPGFNIVKIRHTEGESGHFYKECKKNTLQIHFSLKKESKLLFNGGAYTIPVSENNSMLLYNPQKDLPIHVQFNAGTRYLILLINIDKFHSFFTDESELIRFINEDKKFYNSKTLNPNETVVLNQLFRYGLHSSLEKLYTKGKIFELLSLYFNIDDENKEGKCPFLEDEDNVEKIREAKKILINNLSDPPGLQELADQVNISVRNLKDGFKQIYGVTVYAYLLNYKMEYARKLLLSGKHNVAETSFELGYSTPSHFITAFKKRFGATPKKYLKSQ